MIDFESLFNENLIDCWTSGKNVKDGWVNTNCPFCDDPSNHLGFNIKAGSCNCWRCGTHNTSSAISSLLDITYHEAEDLLKEYSLSGEIKKIINVKERKEIPKKIDLPGDKLSVQHKFYLERRKFDPGYIEKKYKIRGTIHHTEYPYRIIIPIIYDNKVISFQTRDITGKSTIRYKSLSADKEIIYHKHMLYNLDNCYLKKVILVEGVFDVWRIGDNCVCTFGTSVTKRQITLLSDNFDEVYILFDPEYEAQKRAESLGIHLSDIGISVELLIIGDNDPSELSEKEVKKIKKNLNF